MLFKAHLWNLPSGVLPTLEQRTKSIEHRLMECKGFGDRKLGGGDAVDSPSTGSQLLFTPIAYRPTNYAPSNREPKPSRSKRWTSRSSTPAGNSIGMACS